MNLSEIVAFHRYRPAAWLRVTGADAGSFLQGQFTNDLQGLPAKQGVYGLWLDHKGKIAADGFVICAAAEGEFWIGSYFCPGEALRQRLEGFIIADEVVVENLTSEWAGVAVVGEGGRARLPETPSDGMIFRGRRTGKESWEWVFPESAAARLRSLDANYDAAVSALSLREGENWRSAATLGDLRELTAAEMERLRIGAGIPAVPRDLGPGDLPNEGGLEEAAISYTKGCYLGQEVMARLKSRGRLRRQLRQVSGTGPLPDLPAALWQEDRTVGELRSAAPDGPAEGFIGLALLNLTHFRPGSPLAFRPADRRRPGRHDFHDKILDNV